MKNLILILLPVLLLVGCVKPAPVALVEPEASVVETEPSVEFQKFPFTTKMIREYSLSSEDICSLQFYTSHDIQLQRVIPASSSTIVNGALIVNKNDKTLSITIKKGTPGIAVKAQDNYIIVKFSDDVKLTFMHTANKKDLFFLSANKWNKNIGTLLVGSKEYKAFGSSGQAYLVMNKDDVDNSDLNATVVKGALLY